MTELPAGHASTHLSWNELSCKDKYRSTYPMDYRADPARLPRLLVAYEAVWNLYKKTLITLSAYRTRLHNVAVGGAPNSQHVQGRAIDAQTPQGVTTREFFEAIVALAKAHPELGIRYVKGYGRGWVHFDVRPTDQLVVEWED